MPPSNGSAIVALILGILSVTSCLAVAGIPAVVLGRRAQREIDGSAGRQSGRAMATTGVILGAIGSAITAVLVVGLVGLLALGIALGDDVDDPDPPVTVSVPR
jgi:hypothetical protein